MCNSGVKDYSYILRHKVKMLSVGVHTQDGADVPLTRVCLQGE